MRRPQLPDDFVEYRYPALPAVSDHERTQGLQAGAPVLGRQLVVVETWRAWLYRVAVVVAAAAIMLGWLTGEQAITALGAIAAMLGIAPAIARTKPPRRP